MVLKCPSCKGKSVERIPFLSEKGKQLSKDLMEHQKVSIPEYYYTPSYEEDLNHVDILLCSECNLVEIIDLRRKESLLKTRLRKKKDKNKGVIVGVLLSFFCTEFAIWAIFMIETYTDDVEIQLLPGFAAENPVTYLIISTITSIAVLFFIATSLALIKIMKAKPSLLESTLKFHRLAFGDNKMYFFEYSTEREKIGFKATILRAFYGSILVLGIGILVLENFFYIPDLHEFVWTAAAIIAICILIAFPLIIVFLYVSPLITKEVNLYYHGKTRTVKNVGEWLDNSLQFFAAIDIILTMIIIADLDLGWWIVIILCLVMIVFSWMLVFTSIFNNYYHSEIKNSFREFLKDEYLLPIRQMRLAPQYYYCQNCGELLDFVHEDKCQKCGNEIAKCMICGDVLVSCEGKYLKEDGSCSEPQDRLSLLARRMERKLDHVDEDNIVSELACPKCGELAHVDEFYSWLELRGTCPNCKEKITLGNPPMGF